MSPAQYEEQSSASEDAEDNRKMFGISSALLLQWRKRIKRQKIKPFHNFPGLFSKSLRFFKKFIESYEQILEIVRKSSDVCNIFLHATYLYFSDVILTFFNLVLTATYQLFLFFISIIILYTFFPSN